jgi:hypothetical protein
MLLKRIGMGGIVVLYLYTLTFFIFLTDNLRIPAPLLFGLPIILLASKSDLPFAYRKQAYVFLLMLTLYYLLGMGDWRSFLITSVTCLVCAGYFHYYVGVNKRRFTITVIIFNVLLLLSMLIMVLDHVNPGTIDGIRSLMLDEEVQQSPAGLAVTQFTFGYQIAAFTTFIFIISITQKFNTLIRILALGICLLCIYLGMNRSAFISFIGAASLFMIAYYRFKAVLLIAATIVVGFALYTYVLKDNLDDKNNILAKNISKEDDQYARSNLLAENLKICADYPFGLIFYNKDWDEVTYRNSLFTFGLSSHNSYLMFITYLGPFLGLGFLGFIYYKPVKIFRQALSQIKLKDNALLVSMLFSFLAVSLNALSHNGWLLNADGPTVFLYFGILQGAKIYLQKSEVVPAEREYSFA